MYQVATEMITPELLEWSQSVFDSPYLQALKTHKPRYEQSLIARALVKDLSKKLGRTIEHPQITVESLPYEGGLYWSVSHTPKMIAVVVSEHPAAIDIEEIKKRDVTLLDRYPEAYYHILTREEESQKWEGFYRLWTLEESLYKLHNTTMDYPDFALVGYSRDADQSTSQKQMGEYISHFEVKSGHMICITTQK